MPIKPVPFTRYHEEKKRDTIVVSLNKEERANLEEWKTACNCPFDSTVLKILAGVGANVLLAQIPKESLAYLISQKRKRIGESARG